MATCKGCSKGGDVLLLHEEPDWEEDKCCCCCCWCLSSAVVFLEGQVIQSPVPGLCLHAAPSHLAIQDCDEDRHLFPRYLRARLCLAAHQAPQGVLPASFSLPVADCSQAYSASVLQTYTATSMQSWLLPQPEWPPWGELASSGRTRVGLSPILPRQCCSRAGKGKHFWVWHRGMCSGGSRQRALTSRCGASPAGSPRSRGTASWAAAAPRCRRWPRAEPAPPRTLGCCIYWFPPRTA